MTTMISDDERQAVAEALDETGLDPSSLWIYAQWGRAEQIGRGFIGGRLIMSAHAINQAYSGFLPIDFATEYPWDERFRGYRFALFGRSIGSVEELQLYPPEAVWSMRFDGDPRLTGTGTFAIAVYRARIFHTDTPVIGHVDWRPGWERVKYSSDYGDALDGDDTIAKTGFKLYQGIPTSKPGGRHRIEDDPDAHKLAIARAARDVKQEHPTWSMLRIAYHIGLVAAVEDEGRSKKPERAAVTRLERYLQRLCKIERIARRG